jgi:hypothetical protein
MKAWKYQFGSPQPTYRFPRTVVPFTGKVLPATGPLPVISSGTPNWCICGKSFPFFDLKATYPKARVRAEHDEFGSRIALPGVGWDGSRVSQGIRDNGSGAGISGKIWCGN